MSFRNKLACGQVSFALSASSTSPIIATHAVSLEGLQVECKGKGKSYEVSNVMAVNDGDGFWHLTFGRMGTNVLKEPLYWTERRHVTGDRMLIAYRWQSSTNDIRASVANSVPTTHPSTSPYVRNGRMVRKLCPKCALGGCIRVLKDHAAW